ncbi:hypothetical protein JCM8097_003175 [Rhodosporidiobolus ruineniae]
MQVLHALPKLLIAVLVLLLPLISSATTVSPNSLVVWFDDVTQAEDGVSTAELHLDTRAHQCAGPRVVLPAGDPSTVSLTLQAYTTTSGRWYSLNALDVDSNWLVVNSLWGMRVHAAADFVIVVLEDGAGRKKETTVKWDVAGLGVRRFGTCRNRYAVDDQHRRVKSSLADLFSTPCTGWISLSLLWLCIFLAFFRLANLEAKIGGRSPAPTAQDSVQTKPPVAEEEENLDGAVKQEEEVEAGGKDSDSVSTEEWEVAGAASVMDKID